MDPTIRHRSLLRGAAFTSSFADEAATMQLALQWTTANHPQHVLTICTGSQSLLKAFERRPPVTHYLRSLLNTRLCSTSLLWIPGHKLIHSDEPADTAGKTTAKTTSDPPRSIFFG